MAYLRSALGIAEAAATIEPEVLGRQFVGSAVSRAVQEGGVDEYDPSGLFGTQGSSLQVASSNPRKRGRVTDTPGSVKRQQQGYYKTPTPAKPRGPDQTFHFSPDSKRVKQGTDLGRIPSTKRTATYNTPTSVKKMKPMPFYSSKKGNSKSIIKLGNSTTIKKAIKKRSPIKKKQNSSISQKGKGADNKHQNRMAQKTKSKKVKRTEADVIRAHKEARHFDKVFSQFTPLPMTSPPVVIATDCVNSPTKGTDPISRTGIRIYGSALEIQGTIGDVDDYSNALRRIIVLDKANQRSVPTLAQVLDITGTNSPDKFHSFPNWDNRSRFQIISDRTFTFEDLNMGKGETAAGTFTWQGNLLHFKERFKLNRKFKFNEGNAGTSADYDDGAIFVFWMLAKASGTIDVSYHTRFTFKDE